MSSMFMFNMSSLIFIYVLMEINMILFMCMGIMLTMDSLKFMKLEKMFYYLLIQTFFSMSMMLMYNMMMWEELKFNMNLILTLVIMMKTGMYPFSFWLFKMENLDEKMMFILIILQKLPFFAMSENLNVNYNMLLMIINMMMGSYLLVVSKSLKMMLMSSSLYSMFWLYTMFMNSFKEFYIYYIIYSALTLMVLLMKKKMVAKEIKMIIMMMFMMSTPPLGSFFIKFELLMELYKMSLMMKLILFSMVSTSMYSYMSFFHYYFFCTNNEYKLKNKVKSFMLNFQWLMMIMFLF